jgi:hypothetical protein
MNIFSFLTSKLLPDIIIIIIIIIIIVTWYLKAGIMQPEEIVRC